ncbi:sigma-70 family RNA polymerase sigma factor [Paraflavisolibacter sp. H34]|uniref:sigma-70 family RNA polymerase sigma factor n=1 Tax=Huijunlia imazamoxiresistens TaxID=3127457 RepID=UPI003015C4EF
MNCDVPALWQEHKEALYYFILKRVKDENTAKDISQDVLLKVYQFCSCKSGVRNIRSWLFQIASNTLADHYRKEGKSTPTDTLPEVGQEEEASAFREAAEYILPMINLLPDSYALPLRKSDVEGSNLKDVAAELDLSLAAVKQRVSRGRKMLRDLFTECCILELNGEGRLVSFDIRPDCRSLQRYKASLKKVE